MQRREWKLGLIKQIEERSKASPISLDDAIARWKKTKDINYTRVTVSGSFDHTKESHLFTVEEGASGWRVFTPMKEESGQVIFVDRGFVPARLKAPEQRKDSLTGGTVEIIGLARQPAKAGMFTPQNAPSKNEFFWRSLDEMAATAYGKSPEDLVPFFLEAEQPTPQTGEWPKPNIPRLTIPNNHLQYALTWYALAIVLIIIYGIFLRTRLKNEQAN